MPIDIDRDGLTAPESRIAEWLTPELANEALRLGYALELHDDATRADMLTTASRACDAMGDWEGAERCAIASTLFDSNNAYAHFRVGWVRLQRNNPIDAIAPLEQAVVRYPGSARYLAVLAYAFAEAELRPERVRELCTNGIVVDSTDGWTQAYAGLCWFLLEEHELAEKCARAAIGLDPRSGMHNGLLASALRGQRRYAEALAAAEQGLAKNPRGSSNLSERAEALVLLGRAAEAVPVARSAIDAAPSSWEAHTALVHALLATGAREEAARFVTEITAETKHPRTLALRALVR